MAENTVKKKLPKGIMQRKDGRYMGRIMYAGERYTLYDFSLKELQKKMIDLKYELEHDVYIKESDITIDKWYHTWLEEYKKPVVKRGTIGTYRNTYDSYIKKPFGKRKLKDLRPDQVQRLYNQLKEQGYSRNTVELVAVVLGNMYKQAVKNELVSRNPVALATIPKFESRKERRVLTKEEQKMFLEESKKHYYAPLFELALSTGMRSGEIRGLQWEDLDFDKKIIHVRHTLVEDGNAFYLDEPKTAGSYRDIPMLPNVVVLLKKHKKEQMERRIRLGEYWQSVSGLENLVGLTPTGAPIGKEYLNHCIKLIVRDINKAHPDFEYVTMHGLRHTFATRCIENGMEPQVLKAIMGHSKLSITMDLYAHVLPDSKAQEMQKIASLF